MKTYKNRFFAFIAMFPLLFILSSANAAVTPQQTLQNINAVGPITKVDAKATVLAKGQNHLPKRAYDKVDC